MIFTIYDKNLNTLGRYHQAQSPKLSQLKVKNPVLAFDQSTSCTGLTIGDSEGRIHGFVRLTKEDKDETGGTFIANFRTWLASFIDMEPDFLLYENTFSKMYFHTDVILSQLRGVFTTLKSELGWKFPMECIMQQEWKSCVIALKSGSHALTKDNAHEVILNIICPKIKAEDTYEDVYDSIGIYYYYKTNFMKMDLSKPIDVSLKWKPQAGLDISYRMVVGPEPELGVYSRVAKNRGVRYFNYHQRLTPREHIARLASHSNEVWICQVPYIGNPHIDLIMADCPKLPGPGENIYLIGYRVKSKTFKKRLL